MLKRNSIFLLILTFAITLRLIGIDHGFPFIFHPDEPSVIRSALGIRFDINPHHFDWPHLYFYINYVLFMGFSFFRNFLDLGFVRTAFPIIWDDTLIFYLLSRILTAFIGAFTVIPTYLIASKLFNRTTGLLAALLLAITPYHVHLSHFALIDIPMLFFFTWGIYFCVKNLETDKPMDYMLAGLLFGLAASTKYNGALGALLVPYAFFLRNGLKTNYFNAFKLFVLSGIYFILGFVFGTPFSVIDSKTFLIKDNPNGALWQFSNVGKREGFDHFQEFFRNIFFDLQLDFGYSILLAFILIIPLLILGRKRLIGNEFKNLLFIFIPALFVLIYISGFNRDRSHYFITGYSLVIVASAFGIYFYSSLLTGIRRNAFYLLVIAMPLIFSFKFVYELVNKDTRVLLMERLMVADFENKEIYYTTGVEQPVKYSELKNRTKFKEGTSIPDNSVLITNTPGMYNNMILKETIDNNNRRGPSIYIYETP